MINKDNHEQCYIVLNKLQEDINNLINKLKNKLQLAEVDLTSEQIQDELAKQIVLLQSFGEYISVIQKRKHKSMTECTVLQSKFYTVNLALSLLLMKKTEKIVLSKNIRYSIEYFLNSKKPLGGTVNLFKRCVRELPTPAKVLIGLAMAIPIYIVGIPACFLIINSLTFLTSKADYIVENLGNNSLPSSYSPSPTPTANSSANGSQYNKNIDQKLTIKPRDNNRENEQNLLVMMVALSGAFGSIVSILIRLQDYKDTDEHVGSITPILVGFTKPLIGTAFGIFVFALLSSRIINFPSVQTNTSNQASQNDTTAMYYFYFSIAFIVGFSERLGNDIVEQLTGSLGVQKSTEKIREDVHQSSEVHQYREDIHQPNNLVRSTAPEVREGIENAKQIFPEIQVVEDIKNSTPDEPANTHTKSSQSNV